MFSRGKGICQCLGWHQKVQGGIDLLLLPLRISFPFLIKEPRVFISYHTLKGVRQSWSHGQWKGAGDPLMLYGAQCSPAQERIALFHLLWWSSRGAKVVLHCLVPHYCLTHRAHNSLCSSAKAVLFYFVTLKEEDEEPMVIGDFYLHCFFRLIVYPLETLNASPWLLFC